MLKQGKPPTRVLPLPLLGKGIHPLLRFRKEKGEFRSLRRATRVPTLDPASFLRKSLTKTFPLWFVRTLFAQPPSELNNDKKITPPFWKFFERGGRGEKTFSKESFLPLILTPTNYYSLVIAFKLSSSKYSRGSTARSETVISKCK